MEPLDVIRYAKMIVAVPLYAIQVFQQSALFWNNHAFNRPGAQNEDLAELQQLYTRLRAHTLDAKRIQQDLCRRALQRAGIDKPASQIGRASLRFMISVLDYEKQFALPTIDFNSPIATSEIWELTGQLRRQLTFFESEEGRLRVEQSLVQMLRSLLPERVPQDDAETSLLVPLLVLHQSPAAAIQKAIGTIIDEPGATSPFPRLWRQLERNLLLASGLDPDRPDGREPTYPIHSGLNRHELTRAYLSETPFAAFFLTPIPFSIPLAARFEHTHIVGGTGFGKTQLLQSSILRDLDKLKEGKGSIIVIDSQGDMIKKIMRLGDMLDLSDRLVLIDPNDMDYPPALNLFDFGLDRIKLYDKAEREKLINGAIALYEYLFGALLGAELTQRQEMVFRFLARLMMTVPGATIHTLMDFAQDPEQTRAHLPKLDPVSRRFFKEQFYSKAYDDTRQRILTRLWGVLSNTVLERMFGNEKNKLDLFKAMNRGSIILINTAKDLLKQEGCEILGRFFIALICQAAQERASIAEDKRRSTFLYIDEAHDYFDESMENLLNQARKYKVGLVLAHQNLDQFDQKLRATVMASTSIKMVGGLSAKDANIFAREMNCEPEFLQGMRKYDKFTEFACFIKNHTPAPIPLTVPFGQMESRHRLTDALYAQVIERNRMRYCASPSDSEPPVRPTHPDDGIDQPDMV